jgi:hypothetical protein
VLDESTKTNWLSGRVNVPPGITAVTLDRRVAGAVMSGAPTGRRAAILPERPAVAPPPAEQRQAPEGRAWFAAPGLALLAAVSILEGYQWLHLLPVGGWTLSAPAFAVLVVTAALALTRRRRGTPRTGTQRSVVVVALGLMGVTLAGLLVHGHGGSSVLGVSTLLVAATALCEARAGRWPPKQLS